MPQSKRKDIKAREKGRKREKSGTNLLFSFSLFFIPSGYIMHNTKHCCLEADQT